MNEENETGLARQLVGHFNLSEYEYDELEATKVFGVVDEIVCPI